LCCSEGGERGGKTTFSLVRSDDFFDPGGEFFISNNDVPAVH
jgi:hypothetical protein